MSKKTTAQSENTSDEPVSVDVEQESAEETQDSEKSTKEKSSSPPPDPELTQRQVEAILMTIERPMTAGKIAEAIGLDTTKPIQNAVDALNAFYTESNRSFQIEKVAAGYQILTLPDYKEILSALHKKKIDNRLSPAALETLAIIAYKQPIIRANVEAIRGVATGEMIRSLMDKHLVRIVGRAEEIGRPMLYGTTKYFLEVFGLATLKDLPQAEELLKP